MMSFMKIFCGVMVIVHAMMSSLSANQPLKGDEYKSLQKAVRDGDIEVVKQFLDAGKIDNTTILDKTPFANSILDAGHIELLEYVMWHGIYLRLDDYIDRQKEAFSFVQKPQINVVDSFIDIFKSQQAKEILKIKKDFIDTLVKSWVLVSSFFNEIKILDVKPSMNSEYLLDIRDAVTALNPLGKKKWTDQERRELYDERLAPLRAKRKQLPQQAQEIKSTLSPLLLLTTYKGKTIVDYIFELKEASLPKAFLALLVDMQDSLGNTLLHYAVNKKLYAVVKTIRNIGLSYVNVKNKQGDTPLMLAIKEQDYDGVILFKFLGNNLSSNDLLILIQFLYHALLSKTVLLSFDPKVNLKLEYKEWLLHLLKHLASDVFQQIFSYQDDRGNTLLHKAVIDQNSEFLDILLEINNSDVPNKINQDLVNKNQDFPLLLAIKNNYESMVQKFLNLSHSNVDNVLYSVDSAGNGVLTYAILNENMIIFQHIIEYCVRNKKKNTIPWIVDKDGNSLLHLAAFKGNVTMFEQVLFYAKEYLYNDSINVKNKRGLTPLCIALMYGASRGFITFLLTNGASIDNVDSDNAGILHYAAFGATQDVYIDLEKKLSSKYTLLDKNKRTPLFYACISKNSDIIAYLLPKEKNVFLDGEGNTLLHALSWFIFPFRSVLCVKHPQKTGFLGVVKQLGYYRDVKNKEGNTPLNFLFYKDFHFFSEEVAAEDLMLKERIMKYICQSLLLIGADPDIMNQEHLVALDYALDDQCKRLLINAGANPLRVDADEVDNILRVLRDHNWTDITSVMFERHLKLGHINFQNIINDGDNMTDPLVFLKHNEGGKFKLYFEYLNKLGDKKSKQVMYNRLINAVNNTDMILQLLDNYKVDGKIYQRDPVLIEEILNVPEVNFTIDHIKKAIDISPIHIQNILLEHKRLQQILNDNIRGLLEYILVSPVVNPWSARVEIFKLYVKKMEDLGAHVLFPLNKNDDWVSHAAAKKPESIECLDFLLQEKGFKELLHFKNKDELSAFDVAMIYKNIPAINLLRPYMQAHNMDLDFSIFFDEGTSLSKRDKASSIENKINNMPEGVVEVEFFKKIYNLSRSDKALIDNEGIIALLKNDPYLIKHIIIDGRPVLHHIAASGSDDLLLHVLELGLDEEVLKGVDIYGNTLLHVLASGGSKNLSKARYLDKYVKLSGVKNNNYNIPLQLAAFKKDDVEFVDLLLTHYAVNPKHTGRISENPFTEMKGDSESLVPQLQQVSASKGESIRQEDVEFLATLIRDNRIHLLCALLYHASCCYWADNDQLLLTAIETKNVAAVVALVNHGAEITSSCFDKVKEMLALESEGFFQKFVHMIKKTEESALGKIKLFFDMQAAAWVCIEKQQIVTDPCSKFIENISPLACKGGNHPLHLLLKTIDNQKENDNRWIESIGWLINNGHMLACNKKNKDGYLPIGIFLENIKKYTTEKSVILYIINLLVSHYESHPMQTGNDVYNPFLFKQDDILDVDGIKQLIQLGSLDKKELDKDDISFIGDIINVGYNHILFVLFHHFNHLFTVDILQGFLREAWNSQNLDMVKGLVHYGTPINNIHMEDWLEDNNDVHDAMFKFVEKQRWAWLDLLSMVEEGYKNKNSNKRIEEILVTLSPYALWGVNNPLHVVVNVKPAELLLLNRFLVSYHSRVAIDRLNLLNQTPLFKALHENFDQNALAIFQRQKNNAYKLRDEISALIEEKSKINPKSSPLLTLKRLIKLRN